MVMPKKPKHMLAKSPKRDHLGYDPALTPMIKDIIEHHKQDKISKPSMLLHHFCSTQYLSRKAGIVMSPLRRHGAGSTV